MMSWTPRRLTPGGSERMALESGTAAPPFYLTDARGKKHGLAEMLAHGPVLLVFFKISCTTCQYALQFVGRLGAHLRGARAAVRTISQDSIEHTRMFIEEFALPLDPLFDLEEDGFPVSEAYQISTVPSSFLLDGSGRIQIASAGWSKDDFEAMAAGLAASSGAGVPRPWEPSELWEPGERVESWRPGCSSKN